jgi:hypothetical protein
MPNSSRWVRKLKLLQVMGSAYVVQVSSQEDNGDETENIMGLSRSTQDHLHTIFLPVEGDVKVKGWSYLNCLDL